MQIEIRESIDIPAWTSRSLAARGIATCTTGSHCPARYFSGHPLKCRCHHGGLCPVLLTGQKFHLEDVR